MLKTTTALIAATAFFAAPALAGNISEPAPEPVIATPVAPPAPATPNWTGFYAGGQLGYGWVDTDTPGVDGDDIIGGLILGYDYDLGNNWVIGAGIDYDFADINLSGAGSLEEVFRAKLRGGYKIGNGLLYGTGGYAWADTDVLGDDSGYFIGGGYEHMVTQNISLGGELLYHQFDNFGSTGADVDATTLQARAAFRF
ncbi:Opacity protein [Roseovarius azorensis]|uniref:Opacity protein n=1 Tax=Roseovarius azorensis TaxID=1287727 RepID=A0A1H7UXW3_9RHOB|nr:outer membrane beta-barrel protein [Roseovarius azorensis]SEM01619.1 Opacity protein [Roseovarius azorensis]